LGNVVLAKNTEGVLSPDCSGRHYPLSNFKLEVLNFIEKRSFVKKYDKMGKIKKSYSNFTYQDLHALGLEITEESLFAEGSIPPVPPSRLLLEILAMNKDVPTATEKAKSELIISPILSDLRLRHPEKFTFFSGYQFSVEPKLGLQGFCDFILTKGAKTPYILNPILAIVEAKNEAIESQTPQCISETYAASLFNERQATSQSVVYGTITTAFDWLFIKIEGKKVIVDNKRYFISDLPQLLGVLDYIVCQ
jgi:hypothetical protein